VIPTREAESKMRKTLDIGRISLLILPGSKRAKNAPNQDRNDTTRGAVTALFLTE
jgi:hypothetical protein